MLPSRLARAVLPVLTSLLALQSQVHREDDTNANIAKSRKGKKRARGYEGDEVFNVSRLVICSTKEDGEVVLATLDRKSSDTKKKITQSMLTLSAVLKAILRNGVVAPAVQSIMTRVVLAIHVALPLISPAHFSPDATLHASVSEKVSRICSEFASGTTSTMSKSLGLVIGTSIQNPILTVSP